VNIVDFKGLKHYDVSPYDIVIVGSGIKYGKWTKESLKFLKDNRSALSTKKVALFVTCGDANFGGTRGGWNNHLKRWRQKILRVNRLIWGLLAVCMILTPNMA